MMAGEVVDDRSVACRGEGEVERREREEDAGTGAEHLDHDQQTSAGRPGQADVLARGRVDDGETEQPLAR